MISVMLWLDCRGLDVTPITLALSGAAAYPRACQSLASMLSRNALNPADVTVVRRSFHIQTVWFNPTVSHCQGKRV